MTDQSLGSIPKFRLWSERGSPRLLVYCSRCRNYFKVRALEWLKKPSLYDTRPCPYCFRVSYIRKRRKR